MSLLTLPPELLAAIINKLDIKSVYNLYEAGVLCLQGLVTRCHFSANTLATADTLKTDFFTGVATYLIVLNLSGVSDLDLTSLLDALMNMKSLIDLDVSYTNIIMPDFLEIIAARPTLKSIAINFYFVEKHKVHLINEVLLRIKNTDMHRYQEAFEGFKNVHFVGKMRARVHGALTLLMLRRAKLHNLTLTSTGEAEGSQIDISGWEKPVINFVQLQFYFLRMPFRLSLTETQIFTVIDFNKYEAVIFCYKYYEFNSNKYQKVYATPLVKKIICEHFGVEVESLTPPLYLFELGARISSSPLGRNAQDLAFFCWDRERIEFDNTFSSKLLKTFKCYFVFGVDYGETRVPAMHGTCRVMAHPESTIDYSSKFKDQEEVELEIIFTRRRKNNLNNMPKIDDSSNFLRKITHLSLSGVVPKDVSYFKCLFSSCHSLDTFQLVLMRHDSQITFLQHIKEAKRLRNFLIFCTPKHGCPLLTYLSECKSIENICMNSFTNIGYECGPNLIPSLKSKFCKLYNLCMQVSSSTSDVQINETYRKVKSDGRAALRVLLYRESKHGNPFHPYLSVFDFIYRLNPLSPDGCNIWKTLNHIVT